MRWLAAVMFFATPAAAQDAGTLADIRQEMTVLYVEVQKLKRELSTTGGANVNLQGTDVLSRLNSMEAELARMTARAEEVSNRVDRVVADGTNRIGDLEFRLCELEPGCDIASLGDTPTLGGGEMPAVAPQPATPLAGTGQGGDTFGADTGGVELAVAEREDFERARAAFDAGQWEEATARLQSFTDAYQGGPLTGVAHLLRGEALQKQGLTSSAARAYLESYSGQPDGQQAPRALLKLGLALESLGQTSEACITLAEVTQRFQGSNSSVEAQAARANMSCS